MSHEPRLVEVRKNILKQNDLVARELRQRFRDAGVFVASLVSSPGAGKTTLLERTLTMLHPRCRVAALVGDLATENDAARLARSGAPVRQITTGTVCHLEAAMVQNALDGWALNELDILFIENVGNLVCPASYDLGESMRFVVLSVTEGEDKPLKYPTIFNTADVALITKTDLAEAVGFDWDAALGNIQSVRPGMRALRGLGQDRGRDDRVPGAARVHCAGHSRRGGGRLMTSLLAVCVLGFFLGMRHATDPDHVIAVTTIVSRHRTTAGAAMIGALWGVGHTLTIVVVGAGIILLGWVIPPRVGLSLELSVGLMLIVLGLMNLTGVLQRVTEIVTPPAGPPGTVHAHPHLHGDYVHTHLHGHEPESHPHAPDQTPLARLDRWLGRLGLYQTARPLVVGVVHGLAGSAAVALLVLTTIGNTGWSILYLLLFGVGTIVGMMLVTAGIAWPVAHAGARFPSLPQRLRVASGVISLVFGLALAYQVGVVDGLFGTNPRWTPVTDTMGVGTR